MAAIVVSLGACAPDESGEMTEREAELINLLRHDCGACHGFTLAGGLGSSLLPADLAGKDDGALIDVIMDGVPGGAMPPWGVELSRAEAAWLVEQMKAGIGE